MPYDVSYKILGALTFVAVPSLAILAYRAWAKSLRHELPSWRSALGLASVVITLLSWFGLAVLALSALMDLNAGSYLLDSLGPIALVVIAGTTLGFALRGASRIEAIVAGLLMVAAWITSFVT